MTDIPEFVPFPKISRLFRPIVVTEKIDGTNASVHVLEDGRVLAASRTRWVTPDRDNHGFARWVLEHEEELRTGLGIGAHFGEWWGAGIGRRYGLKEKRFSLFNTSRWSDDVVRPACCHVVPVLHDTVAIQASLDSGEIAAAAARPAIQGLPEVDPWDPRMLVHNMAGIGLEGALRWLRTQGSVAAPGFMKPEGVVIFHSASGSLFKVTLEGDEAPKSKVET